MNPVPGLKTTHFWDYSWYTQICSQFLRDFWSGFMFYSFYIFFRFSDFFLKEHMLIKFFQYQILCSLVKFPPWNNKGFTNLRNTLWSLDKPILWELLFSSLLSCKCFLILVGRDLFSFLFGTLNNDPINKYWKSLEAYTFQQMHYLFFFFPTNV